MVIEQPGGKRVSPLKQDGSEAVALLAHLDCLRLRIAQLGRLAPGYPRFPLGLCLRLTVEQPLAQQLSRETVLLVVVVYGAEDHLISSSRQRS